MLPFVHSLTGLIHLFSAIIAMGSGAYVLVTVKANQRHRQIGYVYVASMLTLNATAFLIYDLFGHFGPFHIAPIFSTVCVAGGMIPLLLRMKGWIYYHYFFMNWSTIGLYAAFWAETLTRMGNGKNFWPLVMIATLITVSVGAYLVNRNKARLLKNH